MAQKKRSTTFRCYSLVNVEKVTVADFAFQKTDALEGGQIRSLRLSSLIDYVLVATLVLLLFHRRLSNNKIEGLNATMFACFENLKEL